METGDPGNQIINVLNARDIAIETLEFLDVTDFVVRYLPNTLPELIASSECVDSLAVTTSGSRSTFTFDGCAPALSSAIVLSGSMSLDDYTLDGPTNGSSGPLSWSTLLSELSIQSSSGIIDAEGSFQMNGDTQQILSPGFSVTEAEQVSESNNLQLSLNETTGLITGYSIDISLPRLSTDVSLSGQNVAGGTASCPSQGNINISTGADNNLDITAFGEANLTFQSDTFSDTLNCAEITSLLTAQRQIVFGSLNTCLSLTTI